MNFNKLKQKVLDRKNKRIKQNRNSWAKMKTDDDENKTLSVKCVESFTKEKINLIISYESKVYRNRKKEFYESGF